MRRHPLPSLLPSAHFLMRAGVGPVLWLSDLSCCQKEATARHSQGQRAVALEGAAAVSWLLQSEGSHSVCKASRTKRFKISTSPALLTRRKTPEWSRRTRLRVITLSLMGTVLHHSTTQDQLDSLCVPCNLSGHDVDVNSSTFYICQVCVHGTKT